MPTYLSLWSISEGSPEEIHLCEVHSHTNNINNDRNREAGRKSMSLHYQVWLRRLRKLCEEYEQILQQMCCSSTLTLHHLKNRIAALYKPE